jgi:hypothetical protein
MDGTNPGGIMEIARPYLARSRSRFQAYLALQAALMNRYLARGGSPEEFCRRLAPAFRRRWARMLHEGAPEE